MFGRIKDAAKGAAGAGQTPTAPPQTPGSPGAQPANSAPPKPSPPPPTQQNSPSGLYAPNSANGVGGGPSLGEYLPLTDGRLQLLLFREYPALLTDDAVLPGVMEQVGHEASAWRSYDRLDIDPMSKRRNPNGRKKFILEWQKLFDQQPDLARGPLMDTFMRGDADWSFFKRQDGWDDNPANVVDVLLFSREKVVDRDAQFAAREVMPVYRKHLDLAIARAGTKFVFEVSIPTAYFDFATNTFRFVTRATAAANSKHEFLPEIDILPPDPTLNWPAVASRANYSLGSAERPVRLQREATARPQGAYGGTGPDTWRELLEWKAFGNRQSFSFDRRLELAGFPVDAAKAEALSKNNPTFIARVYINAEHIYTQRRDNQLLFYPAVRLDKVEVLGPGKEVLATIPAASFPAPAPRAGAPATPRAPGPVEPGGLAGVWTSGAGFAISLVVVNDRKFTGSVTDKEGTHPLTRGGGGPDSFNFVDDRYHIYYGSLAGSEMKIREVYNSQVVAERTYVRAKP